MKSNYISPSTRVIQVALNGMLMDSRLQGVKINPQDQGIYYEIEDDSNNWF